MTIERPLVAPLLDDHEMAGIVKRLCEREVLAETLVDPGHFVVVQPWRDQRTLDAHYASEVFADYQSQIGPLLVRSSELRIHEVRASARPVSPAALDISHDD